MKSILLLVLLAIMLPAAALGAESWAVVAYIDRGADPLENRLFNEMSLEGAKNAEIKAAGECENYARNKKVNKYECRMIGICSGNGWFSIASTIRSTGNAGIGCNQATEKDAVSAAKTACGSPACSKQFAKEIKGPEKKIAKRGSGKRTRSLDKNGVPL